MNINKTKKLVLSLASLAVLSFLGCSEIIAPEDIYPPEKPRNFTLLGGGDGQAHFRWAKNDEIDLREYRMYRSVNSISSFNLLVSLNQTEYVDRFLEYDSTYYYYLTAVDFAGNESPSTNIIDVQPLNISAPQPPSRLNVSGFNNPSQGALEIRLTWIPPDIGDLKNYLIYRSTDQGFTPSPTTFFDSTNIAAYNDRLVQLNQRYHYKVVAVDKGFKVSLPSQSSSDLILASPVLVTPANNTKFVSPKTFRWQSVTGAEDYEVYVGNGPLSGVIWSSGKTKQTETAYSGPALQSSRVYYWWVVVYSKDRIRLDDGSELPAQINSYSLVNSFFGE